MERSAQAGLVLPCWLQLIHRNQETETEVLLKKHLPLSRESPGRWQSRWELEHRVSHGAFVRSLENCWLGERSFLIRVFLVKINHDTDGKSLSFHLA